MINACNNPRRVGLSADTARRTGAQPLAISESTEPILKIQTAFDSYTEVNNKVS